jgi:hypothetical protein
MMRVDRAGRWLNRIVPTARITATKPFHQGIEMSNQERPPAGLVVFTIVVVAMAVGALWLDSNRAAPVAKPKAERSFTVPTNLKPIPGTPPPVKAAPKKPQKRISRAKVRILNVDSKAKRYALTLVSSRTQMACLIPLWEKESGWSPTSDNPTSSAYGIPQILGLEARTGDDYRAQVRAGLGYIKHRYGTPCRAWSFWQNHKWY